MVLDFLRYHAFIDDLFSAIKGCAGYEKLSSI